MVSVRPIVITPRRAATTGPASLVSRLKSTRIAWRADPACDAATAASPLIVKSFVEGRTLIEIQAYNKMGLIRTVVCGVNRLQARNRGARFGQRHPEAGLRQDRGAVRALHDRREDQPALETERGGPIPGDHAAHAEGAGGP